MRNTSAATLAKKVMDVYICRFGCFESLHSDQGANVDGAVVKGLCDLIDEAKTRTTPYHPQGGGQVERLNKSLLKILCKLISDHRRDWADIVSKAVLAYNTSVHESTGCTPYCLMLGREAILPLDAVLKLATSPPQRGAELSRLCCSAEEATGGNRAHSGREPQVGTEHSESLLRHQVPWSAVSCRRLSLARRKKFLNLGVVFGKL